MLDLILKHCDNENTLKANGLYEEQKDLLEDIFYSPLSSEQSDGEEEKSKGVQVPLSPPVKTIRDIQPQEEDHEFVRNICRINETLIEDEELEDEFEVPD